ncbi:MAG: ABC transporter substrate-binding protein [Angelakisella sp.]
MKKNIYLKASALCLAVAMLLGGCGQGKAASSGSSAPAASTVNKDGKALEPVTLEWYSFLNPIRPDTDMVWTELNKYFKEKLNVTVNYHFFTEADYKAKMATMVSSGQDMDIMFSGIALPFAENAQKGVFYPLEDILDSCAPETKELLPQGLWDAATVNGHIYAVPTYKDNATIYSFIYNKTMADDLGIDATKPWKSYQDQIPLLYEVKQKRDAKYPEDAKYPILNRTPQFSDLYPFEELSGLVTANIPGLNYFKDQGSGEKAFNRFETQEYRDFCHQVKKLVDDGISPYDWENYDKDQVILNSGKLFGVLRLGFVNVNEHMYSDSFSVALNNSDVKLMNTSGIRGALQCVSANSKNPERALMLLNLVNTDPYVATTLRFGLEGQHYLRNTEGRITFEGSPRNADMQNPGYYYWYGWQFGSLFNMELPTTQPANLWDLIKEANETSIQDTNLGFTFDSTAVTNEIAACSSVIAEYEKNLAYGLLENVDAAIDEFTAKLKASGSEKVVNELQSQLTAWRKSVGKPV